MRSKPDFMLELPSDVLSIEHAVEAVMEQCVHCGEDHRRLRFNLRVGLLEALSNAVLYGNGQDPAKRVRLEVVVRDEAITARVTDEGPGFDPAALPDPTTPVNLMAPGGRGIFLMRKLCDEVYFNDRGNSVTLVLWRECGGASGQAVAESA